MENKNKENKVKTIKKENHLKIENKEKSKRY